MSSKRKFSVLVTRNVTETASVLVEASSVVAVEKKAVSKAKRSPQNYIWEKNTGSDRDYYVSFPGNTVEERLGTPTQRHRCDNCGNVCIGEHLGTIDDMFERIEPGGTVPSGECPECGALCYPFGTVDEE